MKNAVFQLPFIFSEEELLKDLEICNKQSYTPHFNDRDYLGSWTSLSLRSISGKSSDIIAHATGAQRFIDTELMDRCAYFKNISDSFLCEKESIRLLRLAPNSKIKEHIDHELCYEDGLFRIHIPIQTNVKVSFYINHEKITMLPGITWYGNFNLPHSVENLGDTDRIHLVMDCKRNDWSDQLFEEIGYCFEEENKPKTESLSTKLAMIEHLSLMSNEASNQLIAQLREEILDENSKE